VRLGSVGADVRRLWLRLRSMGKLCSAIAEMVRRLRADSGMTRSTASLEITAKEMGTRWNASLPTRLRLGCAAEFEPPHVGPYKGGNFKTPSGRRLSDCKAHFLGHFIA
jgi:hypothetical protein